MTPMTTTNPLDPGLASRRSVLATLTLGALAVSGFQVVTSAQTASAAPTCLAAEVVGITSTPSGAGYWLVAADGGVFTFGDAPFLGSLGGARLPAPVVDLVTTATGRGYWLVLADGRVDGFGDAPAVDDNPVPGLRLVAPVVAAARIGASGLVLAAGDGGVFTLGGAAFYGSMGGTPMNRPVVDVVTTASGRGYWLVGADGGLFTFGDAPLPPGNALPSTALAAPVVGATRAGKTDGLWFTAGDGGVFTLGGSAFHGSAGGVRLAGPVAGIASDPDGGGYWLGARDGGVFTFGPAAGFFGSAAAPLCAPPSPSSGASQAVVRIAHQVVQGAPLSAWAGGPVPYAWGGGHGARPGPSRGTCDGYTGPAPRGAGCVAERTTGVDCSGLTRWVYAMAYGEDVLSADNTDGQLRRLTRLDAPLPGDLAFFGPHPTWDTRHVGICIGDGRMIEAPETGRDVSIGRIADHRLAGYYGVR